MDSISDKCMNLVNLFVKEIPNYLISLLFINNIFFMPGAKLLVVQSCLTLCDSMDCSLLGSSVRVVFQAGILEWVVIPFSNTEIEPGSPVLLADSLPSKPAGKSTGDKDTT